LVLGLDPTEWEGSCTGSECTFHQIAPYIGKMKSSMARALVEAYSSSGDIVLDPFAGSGAIPLELLIGGRGVVCADKNPYATTLTRAKLTAPLDLNTVMRRANRALDYALNDCQSVSLRGVPQWVRSFFHPRTLREVLQCARFARSNSDHFLMGCLLGILHHQRPGFLSYPSSHLVPYLRSKMFPKRKYPELYSYRPLKTRLIAKIRRTYRRPAKYDPSLLRKCYRTDFRELDLEKDSVDAIITSPPYMDTLDYGRDNRLRLWFLGVEDYRFCDRGFRSLQEFSNLMLSLATLARRWLRKNGYCILVIGEIDSRRRSIDIARLAADIATGQVGGFALKSIVRDHIPDVRRSRKGSYVPTESVVVLRRTR